VTVNFSAAVTVNTAGGTPTLSLNDGGTATYTGGSGTGALTFSYTVAIGQKHARPRGILVQSQRRDRQGRSRQRGRSVGRQQQQSGRHAADRHHRAGTCLQPRATAGDSSSTASFVFTTTNRETNDVSFAYELDGATTWTPISGATLTLPSLANGSHLIQLQATDKAGNVSATPASYNWTIGAAAVQIESQFSGPSVTGTYPPSNGLAVGPNNVVMMEGSRIEWTNLAGGSPTSQSVYNFFAPLGTTAANSLHHPRSVFDTVNQRYIVIMDNSASNRTISNIDIAVSKDSNPNDGWYFASLNTSLTINGQLTSADSPTLSVDGTNIYIAATMYNVNVSGSPGTETWVIGDTAGAGGGIYSAVR
jgi:hypothetical protein